jgi:FkbM family methyltransferase
VGANAGYISLLMARYAGESGRVLSFEPNQAVVSKFLRNLSLNSSVQQIIELHSIGLGRAEAQMFVVPDTEVGIGNAGLTSSESAMTTHRVEVRTLDSFNLARLDFMKIDVEGMELDVLEGARNTISRCLPRTIFETLRSLPPEQHKPIEDFFRELGYKIYSMNPRTGQLSEITYPHYPQDDAYAIHPSRL